MGRDGPARDGGWNGPIFAKRPKNSGCTDTALRDVGRKLLRAHHGAGEIEGERVAELPATLTCAFEETWKRCQKGGTSSRLSLSLALWAFHFTGTMACSYGVPIHII